MNLTINAQPVQVEDGATVLEAAQALGINAGAIEIGKLADVILVDLKSPAFNPNHNLVSNLVYSAGGSCVDTVICDGRILMRNAHVEGEDEIMNGAAKTAQDLVQRGKE